MPITILFDQYGEKTAEPLIEGELNGATTRWLHSRWMRYAPSKEGAVANVKTICDSPFVVDLPSLPSPAGKGDREAVDEENILR